MPLTGLAAFWLVSLTSDVAVAQPGCVTGFSPATLNIPAAGAPPGNPVTFNVLTSSSSCQWTFEGQFFSNMVPVPPPLLWISHPSPSSGIGPATVSLTLVQPNNESTPRNFILMFGGRPLPVSQPPNPCPLTLSAVSPATIPANGGTGTFTVSTTGSPCSYSVLPTDGVTVTSGGSGSTFPATVTFSVVPNTTQQVVARSHLRFEFRDVLLFPRRRHHPERVSRGDRRAFQRPCVRHPSPERSGAAHVSPPEPIRITNTENPDGHVDGQRVRAMADAVSSRRDQSVNGDDIDRPRWLPASCPGGHTKARSTSHRLRRPARRCRSASSCASPTPRRRRPRRSAFWTSRVQARRH